MNPVSERVVILTGMSGSGKTIAIRALEDVGFFCIDNLPVPLLPKLMEFAKLAQRTPWLALVIDAREKFFLNEVPRMLDEVRRGGHDVDVLFLDASDEALIRRFSETRRRHPLALEGSVEEGIRSERQELRDLREIADQVIDTSKLTVHDLKRLIQDRCAPDQPTKPSLSVMSFGYKYGVPPQADLVFDLRFLPNPYFIPEMKGLTGRDPKVQQFVLDRPDSRVFLEKIMDLCRFLLPRYQQEGKAYLTIALGCTGGKHRSVAVAEELFRRLSAESVSVQRWDRDVDKE